MSKSKYAKYHHKDVCSCGAKIGEYHSDGCDIARCRKCGEQAWACGHATDKKSYPDVWTGYWPGTIECVDRGWFSYFKPDFGEGMGWAQCGPEHLGAGPDLNRLMIETVYDKKLKKRVDRA